MNAPGNEGKLSKRGRDINDLLDSATCKKYFDSIKISETGISGAEIPYSIAIIGNGNVNFE